jgi:hypothetical protein
MICDVLACLFHSLPSGTPDESVGPLSHFKVQFFRVGKSGNL